MLNAIICLEWLGFGVVAAFEFGEVAAHGIMFPFFLACLFGLAGMIGITVLVWKAAAARKPGVLILLGATCVFAIGLAAWQLDSLSAGNTSAMTGNGLLGAMIYFLASGAVITVGLLVAWVGHKRDVRRMEQEFYRQALAENARELLYMPPEQALRELGFEDNVRRDAQDH